MAHQIQIRRDTSSNWSSVNPIVAQGELGLETNTGKIKIGDSTTAWNSLPYFAGVQGDTGTQGIKGDTGNTGAKGDTGVTQDLSGLLKLDLTNTPLTGNTLNFDGTAAKALNVDRTLTAATGGRNLTVTSGGAVSGGTNLTGGNLVLSSGIATGNGSSDITFLTTTAGGSGTTDRTPSQKMVVKGSGNVGIGTTTPSSKLDVNGTGSFGGNLIAVGTVTGSNLTNTNSGDQLMPVYGDGADGYITLDGTATYPLLATLVGTTYTLLKDIYCTTFYIVSGITLETAGYRIFANVDCIVEGTVRNNGANASGTTGGAGATAGFFRAGTAGANGLNAASAGANGTAVTNPTAATWIGGLGGRGGSGRASNTTFIGSGFASANVTPPANADGGARIASNYINYLNKLVSAAVPYQFTSSAGGGAGAKSIVGTTAVSGGGGGGGGTVFIASPNISGGGTIQANGGAGGNASGTGGTFGGGGGGGGGVVALIRKGESVSTVEALGGAGGTSIVLGTNPNSPNAVTQGSTANTATQVSVTVTSLPSEYSLVMLAVNIQKTGGVSTCAVTTITGLGIDWFQASGSRVEYNTIATPVRAIEVWFGRVSNLSADLPADKTITVNFSEAPTSSRIFVDEIFNTDAIDGIDPLSNLNNYQSNSVDSATTLSMVLPTTATTGNGVWTFVGRSGGTAAASATGTILTSSDVAGSPGATMLGLATTTNTMTNTTNAALAGYSIEVAKPSVTQTRGSNGWNGRIVRIYG